MRDVARQAGVSLKTVSRVVNAEAGVSPALVHRVRSAIDDLGFRPNAGASTLRRSDGRTSTVGLLLRDAASPLDAAVVRAVQDVAAAHDVLVFTASLDEDAARERHLVQALTAHRVDGVLLVPTATDQSYLEPELRAGTAVVCLERVASGLTVDAVVSADDAGAADAVRQLLAGGHRRVAYLGPPGAAGSSARLLGYTRALAGQGVAVDPGLVVHDLRDPRHAAHATDQLLDLADAPTALFCAADVATIGALAALHRRGRQHAVALIGFDDVPLADLLDPRVTVVTRDAAGMGRLAATLLFARLAGDRSPARCHIVPATLLPRGSGELPRPD
jgi:LacI family transcriptional regulator